MKNFYEYFPAMDNLLILHVYLFILFFFSTIYNNWKMDSDSPQCCTEKWHITEHPFGVDIMKSFLVAVQIGQPKNDSN